MTDRDKNANADDARRGAGQDDEAALQRELSRETAEGADDIGDMRENRNLSGSSSWDTPPNEKQSGGDAAQ